MWRNSVSLSSKLAANSNLTPSLFLLLRSSPLTHHAALARSTSTSTEPPATSLKQGFAQSEWDRVKDFGPSATSAPAMGLSSVLKTVDVIDLAKHYGRCYWELSKARLSMLVVATSGTGYILGSGSAIDYMGLCYTCAGTMMVSASASTLNQVFEVNNDGLMKRTMKRPLPSGRISIPHSITWATSIGIAGTALLVCKANLLAASLAASNLVLYSFIYTPLKQIHPVNTWVGAFVGAIPPLLGWVAASGEITVNSMLLPAALYFWQLPHFMALAYLCRQDYADGGFKMFSLFDPSGKRTALVALRNCLYLLPLGYLAYDWGITSFWFSLESTLLALAITCTATSFYLKRTQKSARTMFHASLLYLPVFMSGLLFHRVSDNEQPLTMENNVSHKFVELSSSSEATLEEEAVKKKRKHRAVGGESRPPVAYASIPPFPFLPAPGYQRY